MKNEMEDLGVMPNNTHLFREKNDAGGWTYYSDECGCMSEIWDTCTANESTLLAAILCEQHRRFIHRMELEGWSPPDDMDDSTLAGTGESYLGPVKNKTIYKPDKE